MASLLLDEYDPTLFRAKRQILGFTQTQLADKCGLGQATIVGIENGSYDGKRSRHTILLVGLVIDALAEMADKMDDIYAIERRGNHETDA